MVATTLGQNFAVVVEATKAAAMQGSTWSSAPTAIILAFANMPRGRLRKCGRTGRRGTPRTSRGRISARQTYPTLMRRGRIASASRYSKQKATIRAFPLRSRQPVPQPTSRAEVVQAEAEGVVSSLSQTLSSSQLDRPSSVLCLSLFRVTYLISFSSLAPIWTARTAHRFAVQWIRAPP